MQRLICRTKISGLRVTHKEVEYDGSIELPPELIEEADILPNEIVLVVNENNGARFETYVIRGKPGECGLLGGAARLGETGDKLLVLSYGIMGSEEAKMHSLKVIRVDETNQIKK